MALIKYILQFLSGQKTEPIYLFNTKTKRKETFSPLSKGIVRMYNCGPTVYDAQHIGNMRAYVFADTLRRVFSNAGYDVKQIVNITDVGHLTSDDDYGQDKMEERAKKTGERAKDIAEKYTNLFFEDLDKLNVETEGATFPKATDHIKEQIELITILEKKGYTYKTKDGIYFDSSRFSRYGALGDINVAGLEEGARVEKNPEKKNTTDFALWKFSPKEEKREQEWPSPWGIGFPGWHIECSAMAMKYLGETLDVHTGGIDHIPIHHNNEIAQSEAATGRPFARYWLHSEHVMLEGKKISKSLGNTITIHQIEERGISPLSYRYFLLTGHYKTRMNFTWEALQGSAQALFRLRKMFVEELSGKGEEHPDEQSLSLFEERMNDDLDTPRALSILWEMIKNPHLSAPQKRATLLRMDEWLGLGILESAEALSDMQSYKEDDPSLPEKVRELLARRKNARMEKNWKEADTLREVIKQSGYDVEDTKDREQLVRPISR